MTDLPARWGEGGWGILRNGGILIMGGGGGGGWGDFKKGGDPNNGGRMTLEWGVDNPLRTTIHVFCNSFITRAVFSTQVF